MKKIILTLLLGFPLLSGCAGSEFSSLKYNVQGEYYLENGQIAKGTETFRQAVKNDPENARVRYFYGRFLLTENKAKEALPHLRQAVTLSPEKSEHHFWLGVAYGENGYSKKERNSYYKALELDPEHVQSLVYLGHNLLISKRYTESLSSYQSALDLNPYHPQALYNRALILRVLQRTAEERLAWLYYLDSYPRGKFAVRAADRLNSLENYSYRNYILGPDVVTLTDIGFVSFKDELYLYAMDSLDIVAETVFKAGSVKLNIVVYQKNNNTLAKLRAQSIRDYLYENYPGLKTAENISLSWFASSERREVMGRKLILDESVLFFISDYKPSKKRKISIKAEKFKKK